MYATCIFCNSALGANDALEHFPVGRRLAFDAEKGRLWVVCPKCARWNLSPLEERWEAIEEAERAYRDTKKRVATDNIGLARLSDGAELVRIGRPLRPEFAAWRYGDQFGRRRKRNAIVVGGALVGTAGLLTGATMIALGGVVFPMIVPTLTFIRLLPKVHVRTDNDRVVGLTHRQLLDARLSLTKRGTPRVSFAHLPARARRNAPGTLTWRDRLWGADTLHATLDGDAAVRAMSVMLPALNARGGSARDVTQAVDAVERRGSIVALLKQAQSIAEERWGDDVWAQGSPPSWLRLAMEMSLNEEAERRALEGELHELAERWKEAEEIAAIADGLTLPVRIVERVSGLASRRTPPRAQDT